MSNRVYGKWKSSVKNKEGKTMNIYTNVNLQALKKVQQIITQLVIVENDILCKEKEDGVMLQVHTQKQKSLLGTLSNLQQIENEFTEIINMINE